MTMSEWVDTASITDWKQYVTDQNGGVRPVLYAEFVPMPLWQKSIAQRFPAQWNKLRKPVYRNAKYHCEICGGQGKHHPVEAHEVWEYTIDGNKGLQRLVRLIALCSDCHAGKHYGRTKARLSEDIVKHVRNHMMNVNGWTEKELEAHLDQAYAEWGERSKLEWTQDISAFLEV
jgi:hypothetical protein